jgi:cytochrome c-type biogenesis protein CcmH
VSARKANGASVGSRRAARSGRAAPQRAALRLALGLALALALALAPVATSSAAPTPRVSLPAIEREVMCVTCKIPLNLAQSPQADRERAYIQTLIAQGRSKAQIKHALVAQYGPAALALPRASGFDLAAYLVPAGAVLLLLGGLVALLARWRRREASPPPAKPPPALSEADAATLDADLARFD